MHFKFEQAESTYRKNKKSYYTRRNRYQNTNRKQVTHIHTHNRARGRAREIERESERVIKRERL